MLIQDQGGDEYEFQNNNFGILNGEACSSSKNTNLNSDAKSPSIRDFEEILRTERKMTKETPKISDISQLTDIEIKFSWINSPEMTPYKGNNANSLTILAANPYWQKSSLKEVLSPPEPSPYPDYP